MTRITNFGRKRTYLESTISHREPEEIQPSPIAAPASTLASNENAIDSNEQPPKKKRKRTKKSQRTGNSTADVDDEVNAPIEGQAGTASSSNTHRPQKKSSKKDKGRKGKSIDEDAAVRSESRRLKRIAARDADTTCFACREKGHSARNCPKEDGDKKSVGICYRCGSTRHNLSKCKKPQDPLDPMPFATCFVCNGKGHLASACSQNKDKGVYPNGGCCKLCGDTTHLAKDCGIRKKDANALTQVIGVERNIGADEDDFHVIGRRKQELDKEDMKVDKIQRSMDVRVGAQSGGLKMSGKTPIKPKTVVFF